MDDLGDLHGKATIQPVPDGAGSTIVRVAGELDLANVPAVELELEPILTAAPAQLIFDLSNVTFMDSS